MSWPIEHIGNVAEFINGKAFKPSDWHDDGIKIIRIQNLTNPSKPYNLTKTDVKDKYIVKKGELLVSWSATIDVFVWDGENAALNQHIFRVVPNKDIVDVNYLRHALKNSLSQMMKFLHGSTMKHINRREFLATTIPLPPLDEQKRIASILDKADEIKQDTATIFSMRNKIITSIFTELFGDAYTNSNFDTIKLSKLIDEDRGISYGVVQRGQNIEDGVPLIRIRDIINNNFDANNLVKTNKENSDKYKRTILQGGEFLISIRGTVGKLAIVPDHARGWNVTREVAVIPFTTEINRTYLLYFLKSQVAQTKILGDVKGVAQSGINLRDLRELDVLIPPPELAEKFAIMVESVKSMPVTHELAKMNFFSIIQNMLA